MNLKQLNSKLQQFNKITKIVSDANAIDQAVRKGKPNSLKRKIENRVKNKGFSIIKKLF